MNNTQGTSPVAPVTVVSQPAVPASTVATTNLTGAAVMVYVIGGTLTVISVSGTATGITAAAPAGGAWGILLAPGQSIAITYTVAPTWTWIGT